MTSEVPSATNRNDEAIDIHKALDILSLRTHHNHAHDDHDDQHEGIIGCHKHVPEGGKSMGQNIDLTQTNEEAKAIAESMEEQRRALQRERQERKIEILSKLETMTIRELLAAVLEAQVGRVETYRVYDEGLETVLKTANASLYPAACAKATASFSVLSESISTIKGILEGKHQRKDLSSLVAALQNHEREKLNLTAALHLERIREQNQLAHTSDGDERVTRFLNDGVASIRRRVATCIEEINEVLEELRYALMDEA